MECTKTANLSVRKPRGKMILVLDHRNTTVAGLNPFGCVLVFLRYSVLCCSV
jgi:hypothetical protein